MTRDESDLDFDGEVDMVVFYPGDQVSRKELRIRGGSERADIVKYYKDGQLDYLEGDRDGDGTLDYWEHYSEGQIVRTGRDTTGDGEPDEWEEL